MRRRLSASVRWSAASPTSPRGCSPPACATSRPTTSSSENSMPRCRLRWSIPSLPWAVRSCPICCLSPRGHSRTSTTSWSTGRNISTLLTPEQLLQRNDLVGNAGIGVTLIPEKILSAKSIFFRVSAQNLDKCVGKTAYLCRKIPNSPSGTPWRPFLLQMTDSPNYFQNGNSWANRFMFRNLSCGFTFSPTVGTPGPGKY